MNCIMKKQWLNISGILFTQRYHVHLLVYWEMQSRPISNRLHYVQLNNNYSSFVFVPFSCWLVLLKIKGYYLNLIRI